MNVDDLVYGYDQSKIRIIAGDLPAGFWDLSGSVMKRVQLSGASVRDTVELSNNLARLDLKDQLKQDSVEPFIGAGIGALLGLRVLGVLGAAAGALAGHALSHKQQTVSVNFELKDGRKFIAVLHPNMYDALKKVATLSLKS